MYAFGIIGTLLRYVTFAGLYGKQPYRYHSGIYYTYMYYNIQYKHYYIHTFITRIPLI